MSKWITEKLPEEGQKSPIIDAVDGLDSYTKEQLIALVRRFICVYGAIPVMSKEETAQAILDRLAHIALNNSDAKEVIAAGREWFDRERGKPVQAIHQTMQLTLEQLVLQSYNPIQVIENNQ